MKALRVALIALVVLLGVAAFVAMEKRTELRVRWLVSKTEKADEKRLREIIDELAAIGSPGLAALEALAFSEKVAEPAAHETVVRQMALNELVARAHFKRMDLREVEAALVPFIERALGLERPEVFERLEQLTIFKEGSERLDAAVARALLAETDERCAVVACDYLDVRRRGTSERIRAAQSSPFARIRYRLFRRLEAEMDPHLPELAERLAKDPDELLRVASARVRWLRGDRAAYATMVRGLRRSSPPQVKPEAIEALYARPDRRLATALASLSNDWPMARRVLEITFEHEDRGGCDPVETDWGRYLVDHASELPPQIDPDSEAPIDAPAEVKR